MWWKFWRRQQCPEPQHSPACSGPPSLPALPNPQPHLVSPPPCTLQHRTDGPDLPVSSAKTSLPWDVIMQRTALGQQLRHAPALTTHELQNCTTAGNSQEKEFSQLIIIHGRCRLCPPLPGLAGVQEDCVAVRLQAWRPCSPSGVGRLTGWPTVEIHNGCVAHQSKYRCSSWKTDGGINDPIFNQSFRHMWIVELLMLV